MNNNFQKGFSLIELLLVVTIIGIISSISIPYLKKAKYAAENSAILATTRTLAQSQITFYTQKGRYGRVVEINNVNNGQFGSSGTDTVSRGNFVFSMGPDYTTDAQLKTNYQILATKSYDAADVPYVLSVSSAGEIVQITP